MAAPDGNPELTRDIPPAPGVASALACKIGHGPGIRAYPHAEPTRELGANGAHVGPTRLLRTTLPRLRKGEQGGLSCGAAHAMA